MQRGLSKKWTRVAAMAALGIGPACNGDMADSRGGAELEAEGGQAHGQLPRSPADGLTTHDHDAVVPGFAVDIFLDGETDEDVVLDWSNSGYSGDVVVYRSTDASALLDIPLDGPLAPGVESTSLYGTTSYTDSDAASRTVATPHYFYRVRQGTTLQLSTMVMKTTTATVEGYNTFGMCMLGGPDSAADLEAHFGDSLVAAIGWDAETQSYLDWNPGGGVDFALPYGSVVVAQLDETADPYHSLVGRVPTNEAMAVSGQPGNNWTSIPVFFEGPFEASHWVDDVHFWGVGHWSNETQSIGWYWGPGYADFALEPCGAYEMYLPPTGCSSDADCDADQRCYFEQGAACGEAIAGLCYTPPADDCADPGETTPVCGCDGVTYDTPCDAYVAGTSVRGTSSGGGGEVLFDFEGEASPVLEASGSWQIFSAAPPSYDFGEVPFDSQVLGTDGNRASPYPGGESESSAVTLGPITLGESLSFRSWHVDEGGGYYDRKRIYFEAESGQTWVLVDCNGGINNQAFCDFSYASRPGDQWDGISLDTAILAGQTGTLRFEYQTVDGCCSFEQGWFIDDISLDGCSVELTSGPPQPAPDPDECPALCLGMPMFQQLVLDPEPGPIDSCYANDYGYGGDAQIYGQNGWVSVYWNDNGTGQCYSQSPEGGYYGYNVTGSQAEACGDLVEAQIAALGPACNGVVGPVCGNGVLEEGEQCDGGDLQGATCGSLGFGVGALGCDAGSCTYDTSGCAPEPPPASGCGNPGGGALVGDNGTGTGELYCYEPSDDLEVRAQKACESHFGVGQCCIITGGYQDQQYGQCDLFGYEGSIHWHWDYHPDGHCEPFYVPGDVVAPGWCGEITGNFGDDPVPA
jgi:hypothetical protein